MLLRSWIFLLFVPQLQLWMLLWTTLLLKSSLKSITFTQRQFRVELLKKFQRKTTGNHLLYGQERRTYPLPREDAGTSYCTRSLRWSSYSMPHSTTTSTLWSLSFWLISPLVPKTVSCLISVKMEHVWAKGQQKFYSSGASCQIDLKWTWVRLANCFKMLLEKL